MIKNVNKKGFTLVELIVVIAIMGIVMSMIFQMFSFQTKMYNTGINTSDAQNSGMLCLNSISESIRLASDVPINDSNADLMSIVGLSGISKQIVKFTPYGGTSVYQYVVNSNKLYKYLDSSNYKLIASNVNQVTVTLSGSVYVIYVEITNGNSIKIFTTSVSIRNRGL